MAVIDADRFNAFEREGWAENSSDAYDRVFGPITGRVIDDLLDVAEVGAHTRVLDVATGPGYVAARAASRGAEAIGVDLSPQMLDVARRTHPHVDFRRADAEELPLPEASFDAVVANFCLLHLGRPEKAVAGFARVLSPGGFNVSPSGLSSSPTSFRMPITSGLGCSKGRCVPGRCFECKPRKRGSVYAPSSCVRSKPTEPRAASRCLSR
jgi:SAM-dependent methyltransferase